MSLRTAVFLPPLAVLVLAAPTLLPAAGEEPPEVKVVRPVVREVTDYSDYPGRLEAASVVEIRPRVSGVLEKVLFRDGSDVKQGDLLFELGSRGCQIALNRAKAELRKAEAQFKLQSANLERLRELFKKGGASREEMDQAVGHRDVAEAEVAAARASLEVAELQLDWTKVRSPISGRIGRALMTPGNVVTEGSTVLAVVVAPDPMYVYFDVPEGAFVKLDELVRATREIVERKVPIQVGLARAKEGDFPLRGVLDFADNRVDPEKGTIRFRGVLPNPDGSLLPGMFARVRVATSAPHKALLLPVIALRGGFDGFGASVLVVNGKGVVDLKGVKLKGKHGNLWEVSEGLAPEDRVIIGDASESKPGTKVRPREVDIPKDAKP